MNSETFRLGFDCDGVIAASHIPVLKKVRERFNFDIRYEDLNHFNALGDIITDKIGEKYSQPAQAIWFDSETIRQSPPYRGTLLVMNICRSAKLADIRVITTRRPDAQESTLDWFQEHLSWVARENRLDIRDDQSTISGEEFKVKKIKDNRINLFFEDHESNARKIIESGCPVGLVSRPWNKKEIDLDQYRISNWPEMMILILIYNIKYNKQCKK